MGCHCQYQNKKALFTNSIFCEDFGATVYRTGPCSSYRLPISSSLKDDLFHVNTPIMDASHQQKSILFNLNGLPIHQWTWRLIKKFPLLKFCFPVNYSFLKVENVMLKKTCIISILRDGLQFWSLNRWRKDIFQKWIKESI